MMNDTRRRASQEIGIERWKQWKSFQIGVGHLSSWMQAWEFGAQGPKPGTPGSSFYTNLCYFMRYQSIPLGADAAQIAIYAGLVERLGEPTRPHNQTPTELRDAGESK
jgi:hypothetical protein